MEWQPIEKSPTIWQVQPNMQDYAATREQFSWDSIEEELTGLPGGRGINIAYEAD